MSVSSTGKWRSTALWGLLDGATTPEALHTRTTLETCLPDVERILHSGGAPKDFTLHDENHSFRVASRMAELIPSDVLQALSAYEIGLLLLSALCWLLLASIWLRRATGEPTRPVGSHDVSHPRWEPQRCARCPALGRAPMLCPVAAAQGSVRFQYTEVWEPTIGRGGPRASSVRPPAAARTPRPSAPETGGVARRGRLLNDNTKGSGPHSVLRFPLVCQGQLSSLLRAGQRTAKQPSCDPPCLWSTA